MDQVLCLALGLAVLSFSLYFPELIIAGKNPFSHGKRIGAGSEHDQSLIWHF